MAGFNTERSRVRSCNDTFSRLKIDWVQRTFVPNIGLSLQLKALKGAEPFRSLDNSQFKACPMVLAPLIIHNSRPFTFFYADSSYYSRMS